MTDPAIEPFKFHAEPAALADVERRLRNAVWPDEVATDAWRN